MNTSLPLTGEEVAAYRRDGALVPEHFRLADEVLDRLRRTTDAMIARNDDPDIVLIAHLPERPGRTGGMPGGETLFKVALTPGLLDLVEQVIGPDIVLWGSSVFAKPPGTGKPVQWHQEASYWPIDPLETVSVWVAVDDARPENGCLRFIPGSHRRGVLDHGDAGPGGVLRVAIDEGVVDESQARDLVVDAGGVVLLDSFVIHGSNANRSDRRRAGFTIRFMPAASRFYRNHVEFDMTGVKNTTDWSTRPLWLVRGENTCPENDYVVGHEGLEDLDAWAEAARTGRTVD